MSSPKYGGPPHTHVVFDLDGTLIDSVPVCVEIINAMLADRGAEPRACPADARRWASVGGKSMVGALLGEAVGCLDEDLDDFRRRYHAAPTPRSCLYPGVRQGLARLGAEGICLGVFSNKPQGLCDKILAELDLADCFSAVVGSRENMPRKPDPTGLLLALNLSGGAVRHCCFVGDSDLDHAVADTAGVRFVFAEYGYGAQHPALAPGCRAATFSEVVQAIRGFIPSPW